MLRFEIKYPVFITGSEFWKPRNSSENPVIFENNPVMFEKSSEILKLLLEFCWKPRVYYGVWLQYGPFAECGLRRKHSKS